MCGGARTRYPRQDRSELAASSFLSLGAAELDQLLSENSWLLPSGAGSPCTRGSATKPRAAAAAPQHFATAAAAASACAPQPRAIAGPATPGGTPLHPACTMRVVFEPCTAVSPFACSSAQAFATPAVMPASGGPAAVLSWLEGWGKLAAAQGVAAAPNRSCSPSSGGLLSSTPFGSAWLHDSLFAPDPTPSASISLSKARLPQCSWRPERPLSTSSVSGGGVQKHRASPASRYSRSYV